LYCFFFVLFFHYWSRITEVFFFGILEVFCQSFCLLYLIMIFSKPLSNFSAYHCCDFIFFLYLITFHWEKPKNFIKTLNSFTLKYQIPKHTKSFLNKIISRLKKKKNISKNMKYKKKVKSASWHNNLYSFYWLYFSWTEFYLTQFI